MLFLQVRFLDQQPFFLQQSALQINFPQQFDTQSRQVEEENLHHHHQPVAQGYIDESGNLCIIEYPETIDAVVGAELSSSSLAKQFSRHGTREKTRSSQKRRKRRKVKPQKPQESSKKEFGKHVEK